MISRAQRQQAQQIFTAVFQVEPTRKHSFAGDLSDAMIHPLTGIPILLAALFLLYEFVGVFGAQILVGWLETHLFNAYINPWVDQALAAGYPGRRCASLIGGELWRGHVRLALCNCNHLTDRWNFLHCVLHNRRQRLFTAPGDVDRPDIQEDRLEWASSDPDGIGFWLRHDGYNHYPHSGNPPRAGDQHLTALACDSLFGANGGDARLIGRGAALLPAWLAVIAGVFLLVGFLTARLLPGEQPSFYMELPPLRLPAPAQRAG